MREFAFLQRFFRLAFDRRFGAELPLEELATVGEATASAVPTAPSPHLDGKSNPA